MRLHVKSCVIKRAEGASATRCHGDACCPGNARVDVLQTELEFWLQLLVVALVVVGSFFSSPVLTLDFSFSLLHKFMALARELRRFVKKNVVSLSGV